MRICRQCGNVEDDSASFCPRCGCILSDAECGPGPFDPRPMRCGTPPIVKIVALVAACAIVFSVVFGFIPFGGGGDGYGNRTIVCAWSVPSITDKVGHPMAFEVSFTVYGSEMTDARSSDIDRRGSSTDVSDHGSGIYAVSEYVVAGKTVRELSQKLWDEFESKAGSYPSLQKPRYFADYVLAFVQAVAEYEYDDAQFSEEEYWLYPVETLYYGMGDCEDTSILASALLNTLASVDGADGFIKGGCVFLLPSHAMAGVALSANIAAAHGEVYSFAGIDGDRYYFGETTISNPGSYGYSNPRSPGGWSYVGHINPEYHGTSAVGFTGFASSYV